MRKSLKYDRRSNYYWRRNFFGLDAQTEYWSLTDHEHQRICNGVGSKVGWWSTLLWHCTPNTAWLLDITTVSDIHDYDYTFPQKFRSKLDATTFKLIADNRFLSNGDKFVDANGGPEWLKTMRRIRFEKYHLVLRECGEESFLAGKIME